MGIISFKPGKYVYHRNEKFRIVKPTDLKHVLTININTGKHEILPIKQLKASPKQAAAAKNTQHIEHIKKDHWEIANKRFEIIKPLLNPDRTKAEVIKRAKEFNMHLTTIYRWISIYESSLLLSSLVPGFESRGGKGGHRLDESTEAIVNKTIEELYLSRQKLRPRKIYREIKKRCQNANVPAPHECTVRNRINRIPKLKAVKMRDGNKKSQNLYRETGGSFPEGNYPLDVVQIDHTLLDIILVDEINRQPIGRPWITIAIDVYSRMVFGLYVFLDPPSFFTIGQCLLNGILAKDKFLKNLGVAGDWDVFGLPRTIHADNAREFRGNDLKRVCEEYQIKLTWRPVAKPQYGAHIERLMGTMNEEIHTLPGTTFSNVDKRGDYDSNSKAVMTLVEFEKWLVEYIVNVYHERIHTSLGATPKQKYEEGIFGDDNTVGTGLPELVEDEERLKISLLPAVERSIQREGVVIDHIKYYHDVLRRWINELDDGTKSKRKFVFRRNPRDISSIYFYDTELKEYFSIPYRTIAYPPISLWELNGIKRRLKEKGIENYDEFRIFEAYEVMKKIQDDAVKKTRSVRRKMTSKDFHKKKIKEMPLNTNAGNKARHQGQDAGENMTKEKESRIDELFIDVQPFNNTKIVSGEDV
jgi:putative transposase